MSVVTPIADFFIAEWLWSITWGWYHLPLNFFLMWFLLKRLCNINTKFAFFASLAAHIYSVVLFGLCVVWLLMPLTGGYDPLIKPNVASPAHSCFYLGLIYAVLEFSFFMLIYYWYKL